MTMATCVPMTDAELADLGRHDDSGFGALETARGVLPLRSMSIDARVNGLVAATDVVQVFENTTGDVIEATYVFPLPDRAAVTRFRLEVGGRVLEGKIDERGAMREAYDRAIAEGHRAAITEEERAGVFTMRVGNLVSGDVATVRLTLASVLPVDEGEVTFWFPLVVAPRYIPGHALRGGSAGLGVAPDTDLVPDASRISPPRLLPGFPNPVELSIRLTIEHGGVPVSGLRSSLHDINVIERASVHLIELGDHERLDRDFVMRWSIGDGELRSSCDWVADAEGSAGTFLLTLVPPRDAGRERPRDIVFVIDRSGSMGGWKMVAARRAVARMIDTLSGRDRFAVFAFDNTIEEPAGLPLPGLSAATNYNRFRAVEFLAKLEPRGGTELAEPLERATKLLSGEGDRERVLVLATDGQVGNEDHILRKLAPKLKGIRVFSLGIDQAVNAAFLRRFAAVGGGATEIVESEERLDEVMDKVHRRIGTPVLTELVVKSEGLEIERGSIAPGHLPALFAGAPCLVAGRLSHAPTPYAKLLVTGRTPEGTAWSKAVPLVRVSSSSAIAPVWARARVRDLEDGYVTASQMSDKQNIADRIVAISKRFSVLSRFTAFLAVDHRVTVNAPDGLRQIVQAVESPKGWSFDSMPAPVASSLTRSRSLAFGRVPPPAAAPARVMGPPPPASTMTPFAAASPKKASVRMLGGSAEEAEGTITIEIGPYLERVRAIARGLESAHSQSDERALGLLVGRLAELIEDLMSVELGDDLAKELTVVLESLRARMARERLANDIEVDIKSLFSIADQRPTSAPPKRRWFWK